MVYSSALEMRRTERYREFESHPLRQQLAYLPNYRSGCSAAPSLAFGSRSLSIRLWRIESVQDQPVGFGYANGFQSLALARFFYFCYTFLIVCQNSRQRTENLSSGGKPGSIRNMIALVFGT